ncbi:MAG: protein-glutamine gamma-glutamyltransferase [Oscillospiraceae bacterium]|jgi:protein-glutamine gamma-glutamyltransferase|nr:protein-glutamine gamma-glutamyltransferase [Oscillospiraceae bacterium]
MIAVQGGFDYNALLNSYPPNSVERQVLEAMQNSTTTYRFDSLGVLQFELSVRRELVLSAEKLNKSYLSFATFQDSRCNEDYWERTPNGGFLLKRGVSAADAINDIFTNGRKYATECATAMVIVHYKALLEVYKKELFERTFTSIYLMDWELRQPLLREISVPRKVSELLLGDRGYFNNPDVDPKTPWWQGENVIVLPNNLFYGHGIGIRTADQIIQSLNRSRRQGATRTAYLMDSAARPNYQRLYNVMPRPAAEPQPIEAPVIALSPVSVVPEEQAEIPMPVAAEPETVQEARSPLVWRAFPAPISRG